jgi:photosystem II stability/assembly factor-like uncharacterized protein
LNQEKRIEGLRTMKIMIHVAFAIAAALAAAATAHAETLKELAARTHFHGIAFARAGSAELILPTHHGIFAVDSKGGVTAGSIVQDFMGFSPDPADPLSYYASGHPAGGGNSGFLKSSDGGGRWKQISEGVNGPVDFHQMDVSPADPKTIYGGYGQIQVSHDGGNSWSIAGTPPEGLIAIAASGLKSGTLYAATKGGLEVSADGGAVWQNLAFAGEPVSAIKSGPQRMLLAFVVGRGLMRADETKPADWTLLSNSFGEAYPLHLAINPKDSKHLALTTQNNDVLESRDGGASWAAFGAAP